MALYFVFKRQDKIPAPAVIEKKVKKNKTEKSEQNLSLLSINQQTKPQKTPTKQAKPGVIGNLMPQKQNSSTIVYESLKYST